MNYIFLIFFSSVDATEIDFVTLDFVKAHAGTRFRLWCGAGFETQYAHLAPFERKRAASNCAVKLAKSNDPLDIAIGMIMAASAEVERRQSREPLTLSVTRPLRKKNNNNLIIILILIIIINIKNNNNNIYFTLFHSIGCTGWK